MSRDGGTGTVLVTAEDAGLRRELERMLEEHRPVLAARPSELGDPTPWLDAGALVAGLDGRDPESAVESLMQARQLPCAGNLVLVLRDVDEGLLETALLKLQPTQVLTLPVAPALLHYALKGVDSAGRGSRGQHRPARQLLGVSAAIRGILEEIRQIAPAEVPVLVLGETGTGKELVARAIHANSGRSDGPFVAVNCGALPDSLLEAELFGFLRGAFTGASQARRGLFEEADGGTLFLDEIGDTSQALQVKLLRALEAREVRPLGSTETRSVDVRLVSATHRNLEDAIEEGEFRQDLFYRLNTVPIYLPPLRRRRVDIPFLAQHFAEEFGTANARRITLSEEFLEALTQHDFPGNVRELRNAVERAITLAASGEEITLDHVPAALRAAPAQYPVGTLRDRVMQVELHAIREALERFDGNRTRSAAALGLSRVGLRGKMRRLGLE